MPQRDGNHLFNSLSMAVVAVEQAEATCSTNFASLLFIRKVEPHFVDQRPGRSPKK